METNEKVLNNSENCVPHLGLCSSSVHVTRVLCRRSLSVLRQADRWTGRLTDNGAANVAGNTPSETPLTVITTTCSRYHKERLV